MRSFDLVLRDASIPGESTPQDLAIKDGRIDAGAPRIEGHGTEECSLDRRFVLPAFVDPHHHLDKAFTAAAAGAARDLDGAVAATAALRRTVSRQDLLARGARLLDRAIAWGVGALRTHTNVDVHSGLRGVETALELRDRYRDRIQVQVVAFASRDLLPGQPGWELLEEAARLGCHALGGSIGNFGDTARRVDALFALATRVNLPLDLHVDEHTEPRCPGLECLISATLAHGYRGRVIAAHCSALSAVAPEVRSRLIAAIVEAKITVVALPLTNLYLQGRGARVPGVRGIAPVRELLRAGARVVCGSDNVADAFLPYGNADPLLAAVVLGIAGQLTDDVERGTLRRMVTTEAAAALRLAEYGLHPGARADLVVLDCRPPDDPVTALPRRLRVIHGGRVEREVQPCSTISM